MTESALGPPEAASEAGCPRSDAPSPLPRTHAARPWGRRGRGPLPRAGPVPTNWSEAPAGRDPRPGGELVGPQVKGRGTLRSRREEEGPGVPSHRVRVGRPKFPNEVSDATGGACSREAGPRRTGLVAGPEGPVGAEVGGRGGPTLSPRKAPLHAAA